jgi:Protein of unknown function (DUF2798)
MVSIPRRYNHYLYGTIQSGFTCAVATAVASARLFGDTMFFYFWLKSWLLAWVTMIPFVLVAAPLINHLVEILTRESVDDSG